MDLVEQAVSRTFDAPIGKWGPSGFDRTAYSIYLELAIEHGYEYANRIALGFGILYLNLSYMLEKAKADYPLIKK